jgi:hypothetical protein
VTAGLPGQPSMPSLSLRVVESSAALRPLWRGDNLALAMLIGTEARGGLLQERAAVAEEPAGQSLRTDGGLTPFSGLPSRDKSSTDELGARRAEEPV